MVKYITGFAKEFSTKAFNPESFTLIVDYTKTLEKMIAAGKYDLKNKDFNAKHFSITKAETEVTCKLFHFNYCISSTDAIIEMDKVGYRPANQAELLSLGAKHPELQREFPIEALGYVWRGFCGVRN